MSQIPNTFWPNGQRRTEVTYDHDYDSDNEILVTTVKHYNVDGNSLFHMCYFNDEPIRIIPEWRHPSPMVIFSTKSKHIKRIYIVTEHLAKGSPYDIEWHSNQNIKSISFMSDEKTPSELRWYDNNVLEYIRYRYPVVDITDVPNSESKISIVEIWPNGGVKTVIYKLNNCTFRADGPARCNWFESGQLASIAYGNVLCVDGEIVYCATPETILSKIAYWPSGQLRSLVYRRNGELHRDDQPAIMSWYPSGAIDTIQYFVDGDLHQLNGPAYIKLYPNGRLMVVEYAQNGKPPKNYIGPGEITWYSNGVLKNIVYFNNGKEYDMDYPTAVSFYNDGKIKAIKYVYHGKRTNKRHLPVCYKFYHSGRVKNVFFRKIGSPENNDQVSEISWYPNGVLEKVRYNKQTIYDKTMVSIIYRNMHGLYSIAWYPDRSLAHIAYCEKNRAKNRENRTLRWDEDGNMR